MLSAWASLFAIRPTTASSRVPTRANVMGIRSPTWSPRCSATLAASTIPPSASLLRPPETMSMSATAGSVFGSTAVRARTVPPVPASFQCPYLIGETTSTSSRLETLRYAAGTSPPSISPRALSTIKSAETTSR